MANNSNFMRNSVGKIIENIENKIGVSTCEYWIDSFKVINCQNSIFWTENIDQRENLTKEKIKY